MANKYETTELVDRWTSLLRMKASEYEHTARGKGQVVASPSIDDICNEMIAYFTGVVSEKR
tara:strand:- start:593 stop:775 length:183 start_codon:yes stop_codon:yes gene_type:complete